MKWILIILLSNEPTAQEFHGETIYTRYFAEFQTEKKCEEYAEVLMNEEDDTVMFEMLPGHGLCYGADYSSVASPGNGVFP